MDSSLRRSSEYVELKAVLSPHMATVTCVSISPSDRLFAIGYDDGEVFILSLRSRKVRHSIPSPFSLVEGEDAYDHPAVVSVTWLDLGTIVISRRNGTLEIRSLSSVDCISLQHRFAPRVAPVVSDSVSSDDFTLFFPHPTPDTVVMYNSRIPTELSGLPSLSEEMGIVVSLGVSSSHLFVLYESRIVVAYSFGNFAAPLAYHAFMNWKGDTTSTVASALFVHENHVVVGSSSGVIETLQFTDGKFKSLSSVLAVAQLDLNRPETVLGVGAAGVFRSLESNRVYSLHWDGFLRVIDPFFGVLDTVSCLQNTSAHGHDTRLEGGCIAGSKGLIVVAVSGPTVLVYKEN